MARAQYLHLLKEYQNIFEFELKTYIEKKTVKRKRKMQ